MAIGAAVASRSLIQPVIISINSVALSVIVSVSVQQQEEK
jgi:hypothetical protein